MMEASGPRGMGVWMEGWRMGREARESEDDHSFNAQGGEDAQEEEDGLFSGERDAR